MEEFKPKRERKVPTIECRKTQCDKNLHCFLEAPKQNKVRARLSSPVPEGVTRELSAESDRAVESLPQHRCWNCGAQLVDWDRTRARNLADISYIFDRLKHEHVRHEFWCKTLDPWAINNAKRRGRCQMPEYATRRIRQSVGKARPFNDGRQTPPKGDILFYAQHATATCCRRCMAVWYGIPCGRDLTDNEVAFCAELLVRYVDVRMPDLNQESQYVPRIRKSAAEAVLRDQSEESVGDEPCP